MRFAALLLALLGTKALALGVVDDYGKSVTLQKPAARVVALSPHLTELAYAAGGGARLVGAVDYSNYPEEARKLPRVGSGFGIDLEAVIALKPDLVLAWPNPASVQAIDRIASLGIPVYRSEERELEDVPRTLERLGALLGTDRAAREAAARFRARAQALAAEYRGRARVRVFYEIWDAPLATVNGEHLISKVIALCGGENVFAALPGLAPEIDREAVFRADPDVVIASTESGEPPAWLDAWKRLGLPAAARGQLYAIRSSLIDEPTPRVLEGAERLCRILDRVRAARS